MIVYCHWPLPNGLPQIFGINADGSGDRRLVPAIIGLNHHDLAPDNNRIVAVGYVDQTTWSIHLVEFDGSGLIRLTTTSDVFDTEPAWSPDGTQIAFTRAHPGQTSKSEIWVMNAGGTNIRRVTDTPSNATAINPVWRPASAEGGRSLRRHARVLAEEVGEAPREGPGRQDALAGRGSSSTPPPG